MIQLKKTAAGVVAAFVAAASMMYLFSCENPQTPDPEKPGKTNWECVLAADVDTANLQYAAAIGCLADFKALASKPLDASSSGAISGKTVIDTYDEEPTLYFQNSKKYEIHHQFAINNLSTTNQKVLVPSLAEFNAVEYTSINRRFILGAILYFEESDTWVYEIATNDNASAEMIELAYNKICDSTFFGDRLYFHPSSLDGEAVVATLSENVKTITTEELYDSIDYQPLNLGVSMGRLKFVTAKALEDSVYVSFRDITVLDAVPNDISVTSGIITQAFQTPLAHINVLSRNRGTPNMGYKNAYSDDTLKALDGKWVKFEVTAFNWSVTEVTMEEAEAWWNDNKPPALGLANMDTLETELKNIEDILVLNEDRSNLLEQIKNAIPAFGGKASNFAAFPHMDNTKVPFPKSFAIPVYYYWQFMQNNGFNTRLDSLFADADFNAKPEVRDLALETLRDDMENAPLDSAFQYKLFTKLETEYPGIRMRFRSSTNAEDLDGFTGAGLYTSKSGGPDKKKEIRKAIREVWASVWYFRAFEERSYRSIDHKSVGMSLLVHQSFPDEVANGVAITQNIFDPKGVSPGFYVNAQKGGVSVVLPGSDTISDQFIYQMGLEGKPVKYLANSSLVESGTHVLTKEQINQLGIALQEIHNFFRPAYGSDESAWFAMDTEFKFDQPVDNPDGEVQLYMKQARPYPPPF